jgi:aralkylamine N-acetyltransferase
MKDIRFKVVKTLPVSVVVDLYKEAGWWKESRGSRAVIPRMVRGSFCFIVAKNRRDEIVGMGRAISDGASDAYIQDVVVRKSARGKGIGREIVSRLSRVCVSKGLEWIGLVAAPGAALFYKRLGFKELKRHVPMRKM